MALSFNQRRLVLGIALLPCLLSSANYYFLKFGFLEPYKKDAILFSYAILALAIRYVAPSLSEIAAYRAARRSVEHNDA